MADRVASSCSPTSLPANAKVVLVEPRRMRDRAIDLLAEEDDLAKALASTWERDPDKPFPRLHAEPDRILGRAGLGALDDRLDARVARHAARPGVGLGTGHRRRLRRSCTG